MNQFPSSCRSLKPQWWVPRGESDFHAMEPCRGVLIGCMMDVMYGLYGTKPNDHLIDDIQQLSLFQGTLGAAYLCA